MIKKKLLKPETIIVIVLALVLIIIVTFKKELLMTRYAFYPIFDAPDLRPKYDPQFSDSFFLSALIRLRETQENQSSVVKYVLEKVSDRSGVGKLQDRFRNYWDLIWYARFKEDQELYRRSISAYSESIYFTDKIRKEQMCGYFYQLTLPIDCCIDKNQYYYIKQIITPLLVGLTSYDFSQSLVQESECLTEVINVLYRLDAILDNIPDILKNNEEIKFIIKDAMYSNYRMSESTIKYLLQSESSYLNGWAKYSQARKNLENREFLVAAEQFSEAEMSFETKKAKDIALIGQARSIFWAAYHNKMSKNDAIDKLFSLDKKITKRTLKSDVQEYLEKVRKEVP